MLAAALIIARVLEGFDLGSESLSEVDWVHIVAEATKAAYRQRDLYIADPEAMEYSTDELLSYAFINANRGQISWTRQACSKHPSIATPSIPRVATPRATRSR